MQTWTVRELGAALRDRRQKLGWSQAQLADAVGVTRQWVGAVERGKPTAEIALVIRSLTALGLVIDLAEAPKPPHGEVDLDELSRPRHV